MAGINSEAPRSLGSRPVVALLKVAVSVGLLVLLFSRVDAARLWNYARHASLPWLGIALAVFATTVLISTWRWWLLLAAQNIVMPPSKLLASYLVAGFYNNFLPSNIGGDVIRIRDTAPRTGSKTLATTVVLVDRGFGLLGLVFVAAMGATLGAASVGAAAGATVPVAAWLLWLAFAVSAGIWVPALLAPASVGWLLKPLRVFHREWVDVRVARLTGALGRFGETLASVAGCFAGAVVVQALLVLFYLAVAWSMRVPVSPWDMAVIVPVTFLVQMLPVSINGFGVREATFALYFGRIGLPVESALAVSFVGAGLVILFSLVGVPVHLARRS